MVDIAIIKGYVLEVPPLTESKGQGLIMEDIAAYHAKRFSVRRPPPEWDAKAAWGSQDGWTSTNAEISHASRKIEQCLEFSTQSSKVYRLKPPRKFFR